MGSELDSNYYDEVFRNGGSECMYFLRYDESPWYNLWKFIIDQIKNDVKLQHILDIGCGPGQFAQQVNDTLPDIKYIGIDFSQTAISQAKNRVPTFSFLKEDAVSFNYDSIQYDVVVTTEFLEHISSDLEVLAKIRKDTLIFASFPNLDSEGHVRFYSKDFEIACDEIKTRYSKIVDILDIIAFPYESNPENGDYLAILRRK
jgi:2-polyprenyl-3-methyl-5-hydroxy-6-metoxy-1,4-benzoquinol methylase